MLRLVSLCEAPLAKLTEMARSPPSWVRLIAGVDDQNPSLGTPGKILLSTAGPDALSSTSVRSSFTLGSRQSVLPPRSRSSHWTSASRQFTCVGLDSACQMSPVVRSATTSLPTAYSGASSPALPLTHSALPNV